MMRQGNNHAQRDEDFCSSWPSGLASNSDAMNRLLQICFGSPIKPAPPAGGSQFAPPLSNHERPAVVASTTGFAGRIRIWALRVATVAIFCGGWSMVRGAGVDFAREIEPILIKRCSECHGPDQQKSKLRLDSRAAAILAGKSGQLALVPGRPDESEMIKRVTASDPDDVMPPKGARLTDREVASLRQWIQDRNLAGS